MFFRTFNLEGDFMEISADTTVDAIEFDSERFENLLESSRTDCKWGCHSVQKDVKPFFLPEDFQVYVNNNVVVNWPAPGFAAKTLPTFNHYTGPDGGYVAIYTRNADQAVYSVGNGIYVAGQVRVPGEYQGRIFVPQGYNLGDNITQDSELLSVCKQYLPELEGQMWVGGDTGGWFGIQR